MKITFCSRNMRPLVVVDDRPTLQATSEGLQLEVSGRNGDYEVVLTLDDARRIAVAIDYAPVQYAGYPPP